MTPAHLAVCRSEMFGQTIQRFDHRPHTIRLADENGGGVKDT